MAEQRAPVIVIIGAGGMGTAIAQRLGSGKLIVLADYSNEVLETASSQLKTRGHHVMTHQVDITDVSSVSQLAKDVSLLGHLDAVIHTAGLSPTMAPASRIYPVDLVGTANVIDAFLPVVSHGTSLVCIASMAGHMSHLNAEAEIFLATTASENLLSTPAIDIDSDNPETAYTISKRANILRVKASAAAYGARGARINSISPGFISTAMGQQEMEGPHGEVVKGMIAAAPMKRAGTADDVAEAVAFLAGPGSTYITGTDLLLDGGIMALQVGAAQTKAG